MPIEIKITADTAVEAISLMTGFLSSASGAAGGPVALQTDVPEKPKATRTTKAKTEPQPEPSTAADAGAAVDQTQTSSTQEEGGAANTASTSPSEPVTEASLRARATAYAAKGGPSALVEMQKLAGAANGKMSEIVASPDAMTKLDALLADAGF